MALTYWLEQSLPWPGARGVKCLDVTFDTWHQVALDIAASGGRLLALWVDWEATGRVYAAFLCDGALLTLCLRLQEGETSYPSLAELFPSAARMQRAAADLTGIRARDPDSRPWLRHAAWPEDYFPLAPSAQDYRPSAPPAADQYAFTRVSGDGVHEIAVGPVHAGTIEPGHFRFSIVGEKVLKLEERLGYVHKGIERRFSQMQLLEGHRLAARVSGDSAVAYSWAYCQALEGMSRVRLPVRALWLRVIALESERIANHLGDLGALGNDAGFAFGLAQFSRLKEQWLRALEPAFGQRYLFDFIVPGGVAIDGRGRELSELARCANSIAREAATLRTIYDEHSGVRDRFTNAGTVAPELASRLGLLGLAGRASGQSHDVRVDLPSEPYTDLRVNKCVRSEGDVAARVSVRFDELSESLQLVSRMIDLLPAGASRVEIAAPAEETYGIGLVEGWRGPVMVALSAGPEGRIRRCHPHDPSWQNWPALEHAIIGNIVPDFPLINKSFNLSYSGHDL
ncbi:MAG TPA: NADH-quinone oxidoreductase subunit C [Steroidobacter sp.]